MLGTFFWSGLLPGAPGTWGSLATVVVFAVVFGIHEVAEGARLAGLPNPSEPGAFNVFYFDTKVMVVPWLVVLFALGCWIGNHAPADYGRKDPGAFVLDEVVGQGLALLPLIGRRWDDPARFSLLGLVVAFALFRLFDITKPPPCRAAERLPGGLGIMADDVVAGVYAALLVFAGTELQLF